MALLKPTQVTDGGSGSGSLRDLILQANSSPEDDIIELQSGETYSLDIGNDTSDNSFDNGEDEGNTGDLDISDNGTLTIRVVGEDKATIDASDIPEGDRVFDVLSGANLTLENVVVTGGDAEYGGGIYANNSNVNISNSVIEGNDASIGGGISFGSLRTDDSLNISNSIIENNTAIEEGGGIEIEANDNQIIIVNTTLQDNDTQGDGGGIYVTSGNVGFLNSTISNNSAEFDGGGIAISASSQNPLIVFANSTVANNSGGGINNLSEVILANTIVADSESGEDYAGETPTLIGVNLVEDGSITGEEVINADPNLVPLEDNGGATPTHALLIDSPAVDAGDNQSIPEDVLDLDADGNTTEAIPIDQRGTNRISNDTVDLGAFELAQNGEGLLDISDLTPPEDLSAIRDFDGNNLGAAESWQNIGNVDIQGDGDAEFVYVNPEIERWATVGVDANGEVDFSNYGEGGDTRVVGIYQDPLIASGEVEAGSPSDSQVRFQNDLFNNNISEVLAGGDYDGDALQEVYFGLGDGSAVLHAYMEADGNIQYANYQSESDLEQYMSENNIDAEVWQDWL